MRARMVRIANTLSMDADTSDRPHRRPLTCLQDDKRSVLMLLDHAAQVEGRMSSHLSAPSRRRACLASSLSRTPPTSATNRTVSTTYISQSLRCEDCRWQCRMPEDRVAPPTHLRQDSAAKQALPTLHAMFESGQWPLPALMSQAVLDLTRDWLHPTLLYLRRVTWRERRLPCAWWADVMPLQFHQRPTCM